MQITEHLKDDDLQTAAKHASEANIAIVFVNADSGEEFITVEGHKGDRNNLGLWHDGDKLVQYI
jgi:beta-glucosidase